MEKRGKFDDLKKGRLDIDMVCMVFVGGLVGGLVSSVEEIYEFGLLLCVV
ncbi:hypothetical protein [Priestia megaterium]|nr:hypothetical protein [Priestia megaterium]